MKWSYGNGNNLVEHLNEQADYFPHEMQYAEISRSHNPGGGIN